MHELHAATHAGDDPPISPTARGRADGDDSSLATDNISMATTHSDADSVSTDGEPLPPIRMMKVPTDENEASDQLTDIADVRVVAMTPKPACFIATTNSAKH